MRAAAGRVQLSVLGPLAATIDRRPVVLGGAKQQMVLGLLLLNVGQVVPVERMIDWVWPDDDDDGRRTSTLQVYVSNLRRLFGPAVDARGRPLIATQRPGYVLDADPDEVDVLRFRHHAEEARDAVRQGRPAVAVECYRHALELWRGAPLAGLPIAGSRSGPVVRLESEHLTVVGSLAAAELALGRHRELITELVGWVEEHPHDEQLRGHLMLAMYRAGRQADALACFAQGRARLVDDLGIDPSRELRDLEDRILRQDPSLDLTPTFGTSAADDGDASTTALRSSVVVPPAELEVAGRRVLLHGGSVTIGRLDACDVVIDDPSVSRRHAELRRRGASWHLIDAGSANGTKVNGLAVSDHPLVDGDVIRVGSQELAFRQPRDP
jgi:DNA-binding SARP family transcriptional activator